MATYLMKMPFDIEETKLTCIYKSKDLDKCEIDTLTCDKIRQIYGSNVKFSKLYQDRPYTYASLVTSIDGKIAFTDNPQGPLISRLNKCDTEGATADWWILNMLRSLSDGIILGTGTMKEEYDCTCHIFDQELEDMRINAKLNPVPWNIITSLDGTDIPFDHIIFNLPEVPVMISTSIQGLDIVRKNIKNDYFIVELKSKDDVTEDVIEKMKTNQDKIIVIGTGDKHPNSKVALYALKKFGIDKLLIETPSYIHHLIEEQMMDELFFNYSCVYIGGQALSIGKFGKEFTSTCHPHTKMLTIHSHSDHFFYFRHKLIYNY